MPSSSTSDPLPFPINQKENSKDGPAPPLPPQMESVRSHTADEIIQMMKRTPLFMTSLEDAEADDGENIELEAIRALQYEGSRAEVALGFKERGNEMVQAKRWKDGRDLYTQALGVIHKDVENRHSNKACKPSETDLEPGQEKNTDARQERTIEEACYVNRALCNLELKNLRSTTLDCAATLRLNPSNVKAYYRSSLALLALDKLLEATDACTRGQTLDPSNPAFKTLYAKIQSRTSAISSASRARAETASRLLKEKQTLAAALLARGIETRTSASPPSLEDATVHLSPDPLSPTSTLVFPLLILYPLAAQSDFIKAVSETDTLPLHLEYIFPLPWDTQGEYRLGHVEFYMETGKAAGGLVKVGLRVSLLEALGAGKVVVVDGVVRVNVLLKGKAGTWIEEVKARKGR